MVPCLSDWPAQCPDNDFIVCFVLHTWWVPSQTHQQFLVFQAVNICAVFPKAALAPKSIVTVLQVEGSVVQPATRRQYCLTEILGPDPKAMHLGHGSLEQS